MEVLKELIKLLPEKHEVRENCWTDVFFIFAAFLLPPQIENLKSHVDRDKLSSVDQFYLQLLDVPRYGMAWDGNIRRPVCFPLNFFCVWGGHCGCSEIMCVFVCVCVSYSLRVDCMLLCEQSDILLPTLKTKAELLNQACQSL